MGSYLEMGSLQAECTYQEATLVGPHPNDSGTQTHRDKACELGAGTGCRGYQQPPEFRRCKDDGPWVGLLAPTQGPGHEAPRRSCFKHRNEGLTVLRAGRPSWKCSGDTLPQEARGESLVPAVSASSSRAALHMRGCVHVPPLSGHPHAAVGLQPWHDLPLCDCICPDLISK